MLHCSIVVSSPPFLPRIGLSPLLPAGSFLSGFLSIGCPEPGYSLMKQKKSTSGNFHSDCNLAHRHESARQESGFILMQSATSVADVGLIWIRHHSVVLGLQNACLTAGSAASRCVSASSSSPSTEVAASVASISTSSFPKA